MSYSVVVSCKVKSQTKVGVDDALASLVPAGEPTGNRQDDLAFVHRRHLQIILELCVIPWWAPTELWTFAV